ncbi:MAG: phosphonate ABC transporter, permease protein PhnE [Anaerolinea sp.]|nr:phosphonate ABC transporter, permease protein PhnE [Anaerolinea sp.]
MPRLRSPHERTRGDDEAVKARLNVPLAVTLVLGAFLLVALNDVGLLDGARIQRGLDNAGIFFADMVPPDTSVLPEVSRALIETIQIAFAGTMVGFVVALPLALLASASLVPYWVTLPVKLLLAFVRTVPAILWAIVFVVMVGLGPAAGTLGVALYSVGYLGKIFYELFEGTDPEVMEAVRGVGCGRLQLARHAVLPEASNGIVSQLLFMFEYNVRASSIMGFVGAGGIGYYLLGYVQTLEYQSLLMAVLVTLAAVLVIDRASSFVRAALR